MGSAQLFNPDPNRPSRPIGSNSKQFEFGPTEPGPVQVGQQPRRLPGPVVKLQQLLNPWDQPVGPWDIQNTDAGFPATNSPIF